MIHYLLIFTFTYFWIGPTKLPCGSVFSMGVPFGSILSIVRVFKVFHYRKASWFLLNGKFHRLIKPIRNISIFLRFVITFDLSSLIPSYANVLCWYWLFGSLYILKVYWKGRLLEVWKFVKNVAFSETYISFFCNFPTYHSKYSILLVLFYKCKMLALSAKLKHSPTSFPISWFLALFPSSRSSLWPMARFLKYPCTLYTRRHFTFLSRLLHIRLYDSLQFVEFGHHSWVLLYFSKFHIFYRYLSRHSINREAKYRNPTVKHSESCDDASLRFGVSASWDDIRRW